MLVVEDDSVVKILVARALRNLDLEVHEVADGEGALRAIEQKLPDLVVLDAELTGLSGLDVCAALREQPTTRDVSVMIMTVGGTREDAEKAFAAGATDFIAKPFDWVLFQHRVRFLLRTGDTLAQLRRATSELERSRARLANAQRVAMVGSWEWDLSTDGMVWSDELYRLLGWEPAWAAPCPRDLLNAMPPDDRTEFQASVQKLYLGFDPVGLDHRVRTLSGARANRASLGATDSRAGWKDRIARGRHARHHGPKARGAQGPETRPLGQSDRSPESTPAGEVSPARDRSSEPTPVPGRAAIGGSR